MLDQFKEISIDSIIPPENYVPNSETYPQIKQSIETNGLFHPILLQRMRLELNTLYDSRIIDNPPYRIIAGRARFLAMKELGKVVIPAYILPETSTNLQEIALHENLRRNNLPWYDQVELEKKLHELRVSQFGEKKSGRPVQGATGWSQNDTARELGIALGGFSQDINLANALKANPYLKNIKDKTTALKVVRQLTKQQWAEIEQALPNENFSFDDVLLGDSEVLLKTIPNDTFDACITDPPWSEYKDEALRSDQFLLWPVFLETFRILKRDSFLFIITSSTDFYFYKKELPKLGFRVQSYPAIWYKDQTITHGRAPWQFARDYEPIVVAVKGDPVLTTRVETSAILKYSNLHHTKMIHPNEKPIELIEYLVRLCTHPGAKVIDPFAGSGVTLEACKKNDRRYLGIEKDKKFYEGILSRLK